MVPEHELPRMRVEVDLFRFWTGARPSEAIALRWGDVDVNNRRIRIRRSRVLGEDGRPKTGRSKRDVVV